MIFRKTVIILLSLLIILSGCSSNTTIDIENSPKEKITSIKSDENLEQQKDEKDDLDIKELSRREDEDDPENNKIAAGEENNKGEDEPENDIIKIIPMAQLPELTLEPQTPLTIDDIASLGNTLMLTPAYFGDFRYQVREFKTNPSVLVIDIGNTGQKTIVLKDKNLSYVLFDREGNDIAGSKLQNSPISIPPGQVKRVTLTASHKDAKYVSIEIGETGSYLNYPFPIEETVISDTTPYDNSSTVFKDRDNDGVEFMVIDKPKDLVGNGKFKAIVTGLTVVGNKKIGKLEKEEGFIALVRIKIANTSNEKMRIEKLISSSEWILTEFSE
ncbi:MAG: hypothetical protein GX339_07315 [Tissierellia bacterium]|nr:hypothetical protein [Tissierellia bacterium]